VGALQRAGLLFFASVACCAGAQTFYAASVRTHANAGPDQPPGTLYMIDPTTAAATTVAPLRLGGVSPIGVTGLAIHPQTGVIYGITGQYSLAAPHSLVRIDPATGDARLIGAMGAVGSDIGFSRDGTLYAWLPEMSRLATLDLDTGLATPKGPSNIPGEIAGGLGVLNNDTAYVAATGATGTLDKLDLKTGRGTRGPPLTGAPYESAITNLSFSPSGKLFAVNANSGAPADTMLVSIDPDTGTVTKIGPLPPDIEALIFAATRPDRDFLKENWSPISLLLSVVSIAGLVALMRFMARER
jgi:hypothetical protein